MKHCATSYLLVSRWSWNSSGLCEFHTFLALRHANVCWNWKSEVIHHSTISALLLMMMGRGGGVEGVAEELARLYEGKHLCY